MAAAQARYHEFGITLYADGRQWSGEAVARDARHLRAHLSAGPDAPLPSWPQGATVTFAPVGARHDSVQARITRQTGATVWLEVQALRVPMLQVSEGRAKSSGVSVAYRIGGETRIAYGSRLAPSGITLRTPQPLELASSLVVRFVPPGGTDAVVVDAIALSGRTGGPDSFWTRLKFTHLPVDVGKLLSEAAARRSPSALP